MTLIDTIVGISLMLVVFVGIAAAFELSVDVVTNNKARAGAIALADQRMEYIRSLAYASIGTVGGIPSGTIAQSETVSLNGVTYTRRTIVEYADDPKDGLGASDANGITADYKAVKVDVAWTSRTGTRHVDLVTRVTPARGLEANPCGSPCGTLTLSVVNASSQAIAGASVSVVNASTSPVVNINTFTNASGTVSLIGALAAAGYAIVVTDPGYSSAQTYSATAQNTSPNPGNLTVSNNQTTSGTFAIDLLGSETVKTWTQILSGIWSDPFSDTSKVATSSRITIASGTASITTLGTSGEVQSIVIGPANLASWGSVSITDTKPGGTSILYRVYNADGSALIPDSQVPGNSAGLATSTINLSNVSTTTYTGIRLDAVLSATATSSPSIDQWNVAYTYGPTPLPNIAFTLRGGKSIGSGPSGTIYKYSQMQNSGASASVVVPNLEWDSYTVSLDGTTTGYDIASSCNPQPQSLSPGGSLVENLYLAAHTANSLLVDVHSTASGALIPNATVHLWRSNVYGATSTTDSCGQAFFSNLVSSNAYSISVSATGYTTYNSSTVNAAGPSQLSPGL